MSTPENGSTTGNEFEQPGVNYPDRRDADGANDVPADAEREPSTSELEEPSTEKEPDEVPVDPKPRDPEPSHEAVGIGVIDDEPLDQHVDSDTTITEAGEAAEPVVASRGDASQDDSGGGAATASDGPNASPGSTTQDEPTMDMHVASNEDKVHGIVLQTRQDVGGESEERIIEVLRQRIAETGVDVSDDRLPELAREVAGH